MVVVKRNQHWSTVANQKWTAASLRLPAPPWTSICALCCFITTSQYFLLCPRWEWVTHYIARGLYQFNINKCHFGTFVESVGQGCCSLFLPELACGAHVILVCQLALNRFLFKYRACASVMLVSRLWPCRFPQGNIQLSTAWSREPEKHHQIQSVMPATIKNAW